MRREALRHIPDVVGRDSETGFWVVRLTWKRKRRRRQHAEKAVAVSKVFGGVVPQDPRDMAKAGLLEAQSPVVKVQRPSE